jgi:hypothetical protein
LPGNAEGIEDSFAWRIAAVQPDWDALIIIIIIIIIIITITIIIS